MPTPNQPMCEIVSQHSSAAAVLLRFDIDARTHASETLERACADAQLSVEQVLERLDEAASKQDGASDADPSSYSLTRLIQYIVRIHHRTGRQELPRLITTAQTLASEFGERSPELVRVAALLQDLHAAMLAHFEKEEQVLFPYIAQLDENAQLAHNPFLSGCQSTAAAVFYMAQEHGAAERLLHEMEIVTNGFRPCHTASRAQVAFYCALKTFKKDLDRHIRLEDECLFPRALQVESSWQRRG